MLLGGTQALAQTGDSASDRLRYFPETGHLVAGEFLDTYESASNPELIYGYPITEAFEDPSSGNRIIQYFERARFELHPENPPELRIVITHLGFLMHESSPSLAKPGSIPGCRYYPEARYHVCYDFLDFYLANGGAAQFGYPISNFELRNGRIVQNFQRARFEWHPEQPSGEKVQLTDLGKQYFILMSENPVRLLPVNPPLQIVEGPMSLVQELQVRAFFQKSVVRTDGEQTLFIIVQDQRHMPVADAEIEVNVLMPSGKSYREKLDGKTDKHGIARYSNFPIENETPGMVKVMVRASAADLTEETTISFLIWW